MFHPLIITGSPITETSEKLSLVGMPLSTQPVTHWLTNYSLYSPVNPPKYEIHAHEINTFPTSLSISPVIDSTVYFHLTPSSFKSTTNFSALIILFLDLSISNSNYSLSSCIF